MKIRTGFISNSSSSSFLVSFPKKLQNVDGVRATLFPGAYSTARVGIYDYEVSVSDVAKKVMEDIRSFDNETNRSERIRSLVHNLMYGLFISWKWSKAYPHSVGYCVHTSLVTNSRFKQIILTLKPDLDRLKELAFKVGDFIAKHDYKNETQEQVEKRKEFDDESDIMVSDIADKAFYLLVEMKNGNLDDIYIFEYEDHTDLGIVMEHYGIFNEVDHIRLNNH